MSKPTKQEVSASFEFLDVLSGRKDIADCKYLNKKPLHRTQSEAQEQTKLFQWVRLNTGKYPELSLLFHVPNGGRRDAIEGAHLKAQGVKAGVPDLIFPVPRGSYHGLYVELKAIGGRVQDSQKQWIEQLTAQGYKAVVCYGFDEARAEIERYLNEGI